MLIDRFKVVKKNKIKAIIIEYLIMQILDENAKMKITFQCH